MLHRSGPAGAAPIIFYHGVGGGAWSWRPQVAALENERACWVWEARGHGAAPRVADAGLGDYWVDAQEALDAVRAQSAGPIVLAGHSMGGLLAIALAARSPERVGGLVLVDPVYPDHDRISGHDMGPLAPFMRTLVKPVARSLMNDGALTRVLARKMFEGSFRDRAAAAEYWPDQRAQVPIEYPTMLVEGFGVPAGFEVEPFAERIDVPVLVFNARSKVLDATLAARLGPRYAHERIDGGHYLQLDRATLVTERLRRFLGETTGP
jgi:pimeloyl-ACP methyl ester carboxylesterase